MEGKLSKYSKVFCDSKEALEKAFVDGLSRDVLIYTSSPAIILNNEFKNIRVIGDFKDNENYLNFYYDSKKFVESIFNKISNHKCFKEYSVLASKLAYQQLRSVYACSMIQESDICESTLVIGVELGSKALNDRFNNMWYDIVSKAYKIDRIDYGVELTKERSVRDNTASLYDRLQIAGYEGVFYRLFIKLSNFLKKLNWKKNVFVLTESDLVRETSYHLGLKGFSVSRYKLPKPDGYKLSTENKAELKNIFTEILSTWISRIDIKKSNQIHIDKYFEDLFSQIEEYESSKLYFDKKFEKEKSYKNIYLSNFPKGANYLGFANACLKHDIPLAAFQHGVTKEILNSKCMNNEINFENNMAPFVFSYNKMSKSLYDNNTYKMKEDGAYCVGLPNDYLRLTKKRHTKNGKALYVSTLLYHGNLFNHTYPDVDYRLANWEIDLIENIFEKQKYLVDFKPYPSVRYTDSDPVLATVNNSKNVSLKGTDIDLRYIISDYELVLVSQATSTVGWCVMSEIPLVYIDLNNRNALDSDAREMFKKAFFYVNEKDTNWKDELDKIMQMSFEERYNIWAEKKQARDEVIKLYFSDNGYSKGAGKRTADILAKSL